MKVKKKVCTIFLEHEKELGKMLQNLGYMYKKAQPKNLVFPKSFYFSRNQPRRVGIWVKLVISITFLLAITEIRGGILEK